MAFHQPTRQVARRTSRAVAPNSADLEALAPRPPLTQSRDESQTWVLFSPATDSGTSVSYLSSIQDEQPTPGRSRISDIGSLQTIAQSDHFYSEPANSDVLEEDDANEDDAEFDSLDSHLPDFLHRGQQGGNTQSTTIFPGHDGLGSFRLDTQGLATEMQETMYQFERYNPRRVKRRRESLELGQLALESEEAQEADRRRRIEEWRLEQSRVLLQEIQNETRRRRESTVSALTGGLRRGSQAFVDAEAEDAALSTAGDPTPDASMAGTEWHDQDASEMDLGAGETEEAGYWTRLTRSVIRDLMGIDDKLLCVLFGEALPGDMDLDTDDLSSTPRAAAPGSSAAESESSWQLQLLDRMARELGDLVNHLSAHPHPGAFSTYTRMQQMPLPYAGLPVIPETAATPAQYASVQAVPTVTEPTEAMRPAPSRRPSTAEESTMASMPKFQPTLQAVPHAQPMDIPRTKAAEGSTEASGSEKLAGTFTQQEWEQDLDIKLVFRYLRNRFTSSRAAASNATGHSQSHPHNPSSAQDAAARAAARVRQHHPLVRGVHSHQRRTSFKVSVPAGAQSQLVRHASSCASQSTKRSGRRGSMSVSSRHSSRHYWDLGARDGAGSIGTGSMIASTGPMGSWGEV
ncbi:hypothetical protein KVR01_001957 [Diaporthe batatas]|uniref:uncharacterized protein n=1 Tax=Diaporthe batatas TaxID=748121 RepID=UPI001D036C5E|nr:uncharacterized protein KVR01_001957 [Diaporthe batatas]KAG8169208.1 hypothetical protein KVR01_001957 [Diaporthe batatas]